MDNFEQPDNNKDLGQQPAPYEGAKRLGAFPVGDTVVISESLGKSSVVLTGAGLGSEQYYSVDSPGPGAHDQATKPEMGQ